MAINVRRANESDLPWLTLQLREFSRHFGTAKQLFSSEEQIAAPLLDLIEHHVVFVAEDVLLEEKPGTCSLCHNPMPQGEEMFKLHGYSGPCPAPAAGRGLMRLGFIGGSLAPHPFNPAIRVLAEMFWWVASDKRNTRAAAKLLHAFIEHGKKNADWITMSIIGPSRVSEDHLLKRGFRLQERAYLMEV